MKTKLLLLLFLVSLSTYAQYTAIPDVNFENKLIALRIDSGVADGEVLTSSINSLTYLDVSSSNITDLTGIQDFVALTELNCDFNQLTSLDISKNVLLYWLTCSFNQLTSLDVSYNLNLGYLDCSINKLTSLDVSNNVKLQDLHCYSNQLTTLDVSKNLTLYTFTCHQNQLTALDVSKILVLYTFSCLENQLTTLDVSQNVALTYLDCSSNNLSNLNLKNSKNTLLTNPYIRLSGNPNLTCIQVDDVTYSNNNWTGAKDAIASYSETCTLGLEDSEFNKAIIYPNPTKGEINILNISLEKATVYNVLGQLVKTFPLDSANTNNTINLSDLPKGVYFVYLINQDAASVKKVIVE